LWFRDRLRTFVEYSRIDRPLVVAVDRNISKAQSALMGVDPNYASTIKLVESDVRSPSVREAVCRHIPSGARVLVIDDSGHWYDTSLATLNTFADLVPVGGYVLIEDGHRDIEGMLPSEIPGDAKGVLDAIDDFLTGEGADRFVRRRDQERYVVTSHPGGWIQRIR
jgi:cephalosporin hydroxylase